MDNFMVVSVPEFREWLKEDAGIDWSRVTEDTNLSFEIDEGGNRSDDVEVIIYYEDGKDPDYEELSGPPFRYLGPFGMEINLKKLMDIVDKATLEMFMFDGENDVICEYTPGTEHKF